jgi:hypothetical protein
LRCFTDAMKASTALFVFAIAGMLVWLFLGKARQR